VLTNISSDRHEETETTTASLTMSNGGSGEPLWGITRSFKGLGWPSLSAQVGLTGSMQGLTLALSWNLGPRYRLEFFSAASGAPR
jgi:hypothetical protein